MAATSVSLATTRPVVTADQALRIAHEDGERAYRDLTPYRIHIILQPDGWHIDYEFASPTMQGGGPHYIVDATTGAIVWKRYDQ
jgi:hypothetical protein